MTPGERGADTSGECACGCVYALVEAYGKCGPPKVPLCGEQRGVKRTDTPELGHLHSLLANGDKKCKTNLTRRTYCPRPPPGRDLDSIRLTNKTTLGALEKPLPVSWVQRLSRAGSPAPGCSGQGVWVPPPWEKKSGIRGWLGAFPLGAPQPSTPSGKNTNKFQCWGAGEGWLPKPWRDAQVHKTRTGLPTERAGGGGGVGGGGRVVAVVRGGKVQRHQSHSEHNTTGRAGDREEIKTKPGRVCPGLPAPRQCGAGFGQPGESLSSSWRSG